MQPPENGLDDAFVLAADAVLPVESPALVPGWVAVSGGRIAALGEGPPPPDRGPVESLPGRLLLPGLVNAHVHLGCSFMAGRLPESAFLDWLEGGVQPLAFAALRGEFQDLDTAALEAARELRAGGVTCVAESFFEESGRRAMQALGLRGLFFREHFGAQAKDLDELAERTRTSIDRDIAAREGWAGTGFGLAPHSLYTCPRPILRLLAAAAARQGLRLTIHIDESREESRALRRGEGPLAERMRRHGPDRFRSDASPVVQLDELGILDQAPLLAHGVQLENRDIDILARSPATLVLCPVSNLRLAVGIPPIAALREAGVRLALGTDSLASNGRLDLFEAMRLAALLARGGSGRVDPEDGRTTLHAATLGGAKALGLDTELGSLAVGKRADLVALRRPRHHRGGRDGLEAALVFGAGREDVDRVWIGGEEGSAAGGSA